MFYLFTPYTMDDFVVLRLLLWTHFLYHLQLQILPSMIETGNRLLTDMSSHLMYTHNVPQSNNILNMTLKIFEFGLRHFIKMSVLMELWSHQEDSCIFRIRINLSSRTFGHFWLSLLSLCRCSSVSQQHPGAEAPSPITPTATGPSSSPIHPTGSGQWHGGDPHLTRWPQEKNII